MKWPWSRREAAAEQITPSPDADEARDARCRAQAELIRAKEQMPEVKELAEQLRQHRRVNHFAELFGKTMGGGA
jgi:hypothetical protein